MKNTGQTIRMNDEEMEEEDESEVFKTSLALRAVKRALDM